MCVCACTVEHVKENERLGKKEAERERETEKVDLIMAKLSFSIFNLNDSIILT